MERTTRRTGALACLVVVVGFTWAFASPAAGAPAEAGVSLFDDDGGTAMFSAADGLAPGRPVAACIRVGADTARAGDVVTFAATAVSGALADHLTFTLESGRGGRFGDCTGFGGTTLWTGTLSALGAASAGAGLPTGWQPGTDPVRTFRMTVVLDPDLSVQGLTARADLSWRLFRDVAPPTDPPTGPPSDAPSDAPTGAPGDAPTGAPSNAPNGAPTGAPSGVTPAPPAPASGAPAETSSTPPAAAGADDADPDLRIGGGLRAIGEVARRAVTTAFAVVTAPRYPLMAIAIAVLFLAVQDLIDRRDPKLAASAVTRRDADEDFPDVLVPGGAPWSR